jgi:hypothetical protein
MGEALKSHMVTKIYATPCRLGVSFRAATPRRRQDLGGDCLVRQNDFGAPLNVTSVLHRSA